ncbi:hypothetical protein U1Q18_044618, partial [Sarracenia purpurea var. burkii]
IEDEDTSRGFEVGDKVPSPQAQVSDFTLSPVVVNVMDEGEGKRDGNDEGISDEGPVIVDTDMRDANMRIEKGINPLVRSSDLKAESVDPLKHAHK